MKLDQAIQILEIEVKSYPEGEDPELVKALKLGIEALKAIYADRGGDARLINRPLPGETEE